MKPRPLVPDLLALAAILGLVLIFFWKIALANLIWVGLDAFAYFYPYRDYAAKEILNGNIPLWNPYLFMGAPFLANPQAQVFYPLNWIFLTLPAPKAVAYSLVLHIFLAGAFTYLFARHSLKLQPFPAFLSGVVLALGGFFAAHAQHLTLVSAWAWTPLLLLLFQKSVRERGIYPLLTGGVVGLQFLAGHPQAAFISLFLLVLWSLYLAWAEGNGWRRNRILANLFLGALAVGIGAGLTAVQLLPTWELANLSIRSGGLAFREAVSFSLNPQLLLVGLLPALIDSPYSEYIAYTGLVPLILALGALRTERRRQAFFFGAIALFGIFLALGLYNPVYFLLYRLVPGFALFRVPARWLFLFSFGMAILAGMGADAWLRGQWNVPFRIPRLSPPLLVALVVLVVFLALQQWPSLLVVLFWLAIGIGGVGIIIWGIRSREKRGVTILLLVLALGELFLADPLRVDDLTTAPEAYTSLRTSTLHLLADPDLFRTLSFSQLVFDPGDLRDIQQIFEDWLSPYAIYNYVVATKMKEVLVPNLSLAYRIPTVDGYDPVPPARFVDWQRLFLSEDELSPDGKLWQRLQEIPPGRLLSLMNVKYVIMDKVQDLWIDGVYYDLGHRAALGPGEEVAIADVPWFPATAIGLVSYLEGFPQAEPETVVAELLVEAEDRKHSSHLIEFGFDTSSPESPYRARQVGQGLYHSLFRLEQPGALQKITIRYLASQGRLVVRGLSLIDERTGMHQPLVVSTNGRWRLVHSGDVKIYENLDVLPRAFIVHKGRMVGDEEAALQGIADPSFVPGKEAVFIGEGDSITFDTGSGQEEVTILEYEPERVLIRALLESPGYLILTDADYPGWRATVDGKTAEILRADYYFRAVVLEAGEHVIEFVYDPLSFKVGAAITIATALAIAFYSLLWCYRRLSSQSV